MTVSFRLTNPIEGQPGILLTVPIPDLQKYSVWMQTLRDLRAFAEQHPEVIDPAHNLTGSAVDEGHGHDWADTTEPAIDIGIYPFERDIVSNQRWTDFRFFLLNRYRERPIVAYAADLDGYEKWGRTGQYIHRDGEPGAQFVGKRTMRRLEPLFAAAIMNVGVAEITKMLEEAAAREVPVLVGG